MKRTSDARGHFDVWRGDCLEVVPGLVGRGNEAFELVYLDPPFNTGLRHGARGRRGDRAKGRQAYDDRWGSLEAFLEMLRPRLAAVRDVMAEEASLWLHLDYRTVHEAKVMAAQVLGRRAFQGEIVWVPGNGGRRRNGPSTTHQTLLVFAPGGKMVWNASDPVLRESFASTSLRTHFRNVDPSGRRYRDRVVNGKTYRYYADDGRRLGSVWTDCPAMAANTPLTDESTGYPTQKPLRLLDRIVRAATRPGARVLDPMCGSGTALVAAQRSGRRWAGVDSSALACRVARSRLAAGGHGPGAQRPTVE